MSEKRLSVVIPTYNRRDRLARVLAALERQTMPADEFEVVVVDDGSTDGSSDWLATRKPAYALRTLRLSNGGPARARNAGVEAATGDILLFIDDDVEPTDSLIAEHLKHLDIDRGLATSSISRHVATIRVFGRFIHSQGFTKSDPAELLMQPSNWQTIPGVMGHEQVKALLAAPQPALDKLTRIALEMPSELPGPPGQGQKDRARERRARQLRVGPDNRPSLGTEQARESDHQRQ